MNTSKDILKIINNSIYPDKVITIITKNHSLHKLLLTKEKKQYYLIFKKSGAFRKFSELFNVPDEYKWVWS